LIGYQPFLNHVQLLPGREAPDEGSIKVLSYNVQNMAHSNINLERAEVSRGTPGQGRQKY